MEIRVEQQSKEQRRREVALYNGRMAAELITSPAWAWYIEQVGALATDAETRLLSPNTILEVRQEDRLRGTIAAYRTLPGIITKSAAAFAKAMSKQERQP